jgi:hypothetical protein
MSKQRFYIDTSGNDDAAYTEAMRKACELADGDPQIKKIVLLINSKGSTGWFERLFDSAIVKKLHIGYKFSDCRPIFKFETVKTYRDTFDASEIVITCGLDSADVLKIDDYHSIKAIIAIPWLKDGLKKWVQTWGPTDIRGGAVATAYPEPSCIVQKAMIELSESINMSTGITHPSDEEMAKTFILSLHKYESSLDANIVGSYLVRELHWDTEDAKEIEKLINTLNSGKHFKGGSRTGLQHPYKRWERECEEEE